MIEVAGFGCLLRPGGRNGRVCQAQLTEYCPFREQSDDQTDQSGRFTPSALTPSEGKLDFDVNFYERGLFPPAAFHSEGHQDSMGVCLYLALMKRRSLDLGHKP